MNTPKVTSSVERRVSFFLPVQRNQQYRRLDGTRTWRHDYRLTDDAREISCEAVFLTNIAVNIVEQLLGFKEDESPGGSALIESNAGGPELRIVVDMDRLPYTAVSFKAACQAVSDLINREEDFFADAPRSDFDVPDFDVPDTVRKTLKPRRSRAKP